MHSALPTSIVLSFTNLHTSYLRLPLRDYLSIDWKNVNI